MTDTTAQTIDQFEEPETRRARWEAAAHAAGREVDRNALAAYMAVADVELKALADNWAHSVASTDMEIRRLKARIVELECQLREREEQWAGEDAAARPAAPTAPDTLPAWLYRRFMPQGNGWDGLDEGQRAYWEHQARAVRRAVARGGFKTTERATVPAAVETGE